MGRIITLSILSSHNAVKFVRDLLPVGLLAITTIDKTSSLSKRNRVAYWEATKLVGRPRCHVEIEAAGDNAITSRIDPYLSQR